MINLKYIAIIFIALSKTALSSNDTLEILTQINKRKIFGFHHAPKKDADIMLTIQMKWNDSILPECKLTNFYRFGAKTISDTITSVAFMPDKPGELGALALKDVASHGSTSDMIIKGQDGKTYGFGYRNKIEINPSKTKQVLIEVDGDFHPWGKEIQKFAEEILTAQDTTFSKVLDFGRLTIQFSHIK